MSTAKHLYIVQTGQTFAAIAEQYGDFDALIAHGLHTDAPSTSIIKTIHAFSINAETFDWPLPSECAGVVISGSHDMVTDEAPWMRSLEKWIQRLANANTPILGICFGHQLLGKALGGVSGPNPNGLELGTVDINFTEAALTDALLKNMPRTIPVHVVHYQSVLTLPAQATLLASNAHEPHQSFRIGEHIWGVQFHPEFTQAVMQGYISHTPVSQPAKKHAQINETPASASLLKLFANYVFNR